jgi:hypothetical protein
MCRSTTIPENTIGKINIPYMGLNIPIPGDQTEKEWTVEAFIDDFSIRNEFENWMELIRPQEVPGGVDVAGAIRTATVDMLGVDGTILRSYKMLRCWPMTVGEIELNHDNTDTIGTFSVTFALSAWTKI